MGVATQEQLLAAKRARTRLRKTKRDIAVAVRTAKLRETIAGLKKKIENRDRRIGSLATELDETKTELKGLTDRMDADWTPPKEALGISEFTHDSTPTVEAPVAQLGT